MRILALDIGERRVGVAVSDPDGRVALPLDVLDAGVLRGDVRELAALVESEHAEMVVVGLPLSLDGAEGPQTARVREIGERLARFLRVPVEYFDERFSSAEARRAARESGVDERSQRGSLDAAAAAVFLQDWLDRRNAERRNPMSRKANEHGGAAARFLLVAVGLLALAALVAGVGFAWVMGRVGASSAASTPVQITVSSGSSTGDIAALLVRQGVVANGTRFRLRTKLAGADGQLKAGVYELSTNMPDELVIARLKEGPQIIYKTVTIPEGFSIRQVAERVEEKTGVPRAEFLELAQHGAKRFAGKYPYLRKAYGGSLEGFLFPKTYAVREGASAKDVIEMMLAQFDREVAEAGIKPPQGTSAADWYYRLATTASLVEREARVPKDRPLIASVIYNRLNRGMRLQLCSSVVYVLGRHELRLTDAETRIQSPYNTYRYKGLPPGPIANPGLAALKAAANPADTSYIFFVLTGKDGSHTFARDMKGFLAAKRISKEVFGQ